LIVRRAICRRAGLVTLLILTTGSSAADAQPVLLAVRPRAGDTLYVTFEQTVTIHGAPRGSTDSTPMTTTHHVRTREVFERADGTASVMRAIIDSVKTRSTGSIPLAPSRADRAAEGQNVRLRVSVDGGAEVIDGVTPLDPELRALLGGTPPMLPPTPVAVGATWIRDFPLPEGSQPDGADALRATFRLDSLTNGGEHAWISVRGRVGDGSARIGERPPGFRTGTITGTLRLDRRRGWLIETHAVVTMESVVAMPGAAAPLVVSVRVVQDMRTAPPRP
jgi:hypothetical protein